jgi:hypothetical protein
MLFVTVDSFNYGGVDTQILIKYGIKSSEISSWTFKKH